jgi:hypothetical protein
MHSQSRQKNPLSVIKLKQKPLRGSNYAGQITIASLVTQVSFLFIQQVASEVRWL